MEKDPQPAATPAEPKQPSAPPPPPFEPDLDLIGDMERSQKGGPERR